MKLSKLKSLIISHWPLIIFVSAVVVFFWKFWFKDLLPIPADTIVGMYHPWRDKVWDGLTAGVPFKNFLITDPVRQQFPWRQLAMEIWPRGQLPWWNPYSLAGTPLLANFQSAVFYPLNSLFIILDSKIAWAILIFLQPLLAGILLHFYLRQLKLRPSSCLFGALCWAFSGFFMAWLEWGTILHTALWLPLILLAIEKIIARLPTGGSGRCWPAVLVVSLVMAFFAGHLQVFFYICLFSFIYLLWRLQGAKKDRKRKLILLFAICYLLFAIATAIQWQPSWEFIRLSAREADQADWQKPGWFIPFKHLVQFLAPDFFGNPTTLNYWGEWNYGEFVGFIGVIGLLFAFLGAKSRQAWFFLLAGLAALSFALPTLWAKLPYQWRLPLVGTSQPTRLLVIIDFCFAVLAAFGVEALWRKKKIIRPVIIFFTAYLFLWFLVILAPKIWPQATWLDHLTVAKRNLILPTGMMLVATVLVLVARVGWLREISLAGLAVLLVFDLLRFGWKFTPFVKKDWLFPSTAALEFLESDQDVFRVMATDRRILPPNFNVVFRLQSVSGYDPLYLRRYGELVAAWERSEPDISPPFGFNRIITPQNFESRLTDLLNVKYILSLTDLDSEKLELVFQEGETRVYENKNVMPRVFVVFDYLVAKNKQETIGLLMDGVTDLTKTVVLELHPGVEKHLHPGEGKAKVENYEENQVVIDAELPIEGILVLTDAFYPGWQATIDDQSVPIWRANYHFRAVVVPAGKHQVIFKYGF